MRLLKVVSVTLAVTALTGCHATFSTPSGIRENWRGVNGTITTGKASPDVMDAYHQTQQETDYNALQNNLAKIQGMTNEQ